MNSNYKDFALRLREERVRCGLTQQQLCRRLQTPQSAFSRAETGCIRFSYIKLKYISATDIDIYYVFTGNRAPDILDFPELSKTASEELSYLLNVVSIHVNAARTYSRLFPQNPLKPSFEQAGKHLEYLQYLSENTKAHPNIFYCLRHYYGYTQGKMAGLLGMDIKKLRSLEVGRLFPDSEIIWKMYHQFHISPAFILKDPKGMRQELNYILGLLEEDARNTMLRILRDGYDLMWTRNS